MKQRNNVTDHTSEVDRDQDRKSTRGDLGGLCAPVLTYLSPFRKNTVKRSPAENGGNKQLETHESWLQYGKAVTILCLS